jgi:hypothetical protein
MIIMIIILKTLQDINFLNFNILIFDVFTTKWMFDTLVSYRKSVKSHNS